MLQNIYANLVQHFSILNTCWRQPAYEIFSIEYNFSSTSPDIQGSLRIWVSNKGAP